VRKPFDGFRMFWKDGSSFSEEKEAKRLGAVPDPQRI
jgi:hypothetical protein